MKWISERHWGKEGPTRKIQKRLTHKTFGQRGDEESQKKLVVLAAEKEK